MKVLTHDEMKHIVRSTTAKRFKVTFPDGRKKVMRLTISSSGHVIYLPRMVKRYGYPLENVVNIEPLEISNPVERVLKGVERARAIWRQCHPNLWKHKRMGFELLDIEQLRKQLLLQSLAGMNYRELEKFALDILKEWDLYTEGLIFPEGYKKIYIKSLKEEGYLCYGQYQSCINNIKKHLDNREEFEYRWRGFFHDITVRGFEDGDYRATLALEYRNTANGHYYLLLNEKFGIHVEDD